MSEPKINARLRENVGKAYAQRLRRTGEVPCILYGVEKESVALSVNIKDLQKLLSETRSVIVVNYGETKQRSVVKNIQYHPLKGEIIHIDLMRVKAGQEINISVPLKFVGSAEGVKVGGVFQELKSDLDITCLPKYMPNEIEVEVSELSIGDALHVSDLVLENITINADPTTSLCSVAAPKKIEEELPLEEEEVEDEEAEPEVITARDKKEEEEEKQEG